MKKLMIGLSAFVGLLVVSAIVIPLVVDVDQYRPKIVQIANENLNGKLDLGKLSLSLWGTIKIQVDGIDLKDSKQNPVLSVKEAFVHVPWMSIFKASPEMILRMKEPKLSVLREKTGVMNVATLAKADVAGSDSTGKGAQAKDTPASSSDLKEQAPSDGTKELVLPAIALRSRLGLELIQAELKFTDLQAANNIELKDLNVAIHNLGLSHPIDFMISTVVGTTMSSGTAVKGPIALSGKVNPEIESGKLGKISAQVVFKGTDLEVQQPGVFSKSAGVLTQADLDVVYSDPVISLNQIKIQFHNAVITAKGQVSEKATQLTVESNEVDLGAWKSLVPAIQENSVRGFFAFQAKTQGPNDKLDYSAEVKLRDVLVKNPMLKAEPKIGLTVSVKTDQVESLLMQITAPGSDLQVRGKLKSFTRPQFDFQVNSKSLDLDQLLVFAPTVAPSEKKGASIFGVSEAYATQKGKSAETSDLDKSLDAFRTNPIAAQANGTVEFNFQKIKAQNVILDSMAGRLALNDGVATLSGFGFKVFDGSIQMGAKIALKPTRPTYQFNSSISKLSMQKAIDSQMAMFKNTVYGTADFKLEGSGTSFNSDLATKNLNAKGTLKLSDAKFTSIDIAKIVNESLEESLGKITSKFPGLGSKGVKKLSSGATEYEVIASDFQIKDAVFSMPNFTAQSKPGKAVDLKGQTTVNLANQGLQARWEVIDVHNVTGAKDLSVDIAGKRIDSILAEKNQPVRFPVVVTGTLASPQVSKTETIEHLMKVALKNTSSGVASKAKDEVVNKVLKGIGLGGGGSGKDSAPADHNPLKGGLKKLFR